MSSEASEGDPVIALSVRHLLWSKWRALRNTPASQNEGGWKRILLLGVLGTVVWAGIFAASLWFMERTLALEPIGEILVRKLLGMAFLIFFSVLLFSNIIAVFSTFLLAEDLRYLMVRPIPSNTLFSARFLENAVYSSWMVVIFGLAVFIAAGQAFDAPLAYYGWLTVVLMGVVLIPPSLAVIAVMLLTNLMPVQRTREFFIGLAVVVFVGLFFLFRSMEPERLLDPNQFSSTMELFAAIQTPSSYWWPSSWAMEVLYPQLRGSLTPPEYLYLASLYATGLGLFFVAAWSFRLLHRRAYSRALEGRSSSQASTARTLSDDAPERGKLLKGIRRLGRKEGVLGPIRAIASKDARVFVRDTVQWSQMLLLVGLGAIYLLNFRYIGAIGKGGILGPVGLFFLNIALSGFLVAAVSVRLVFPAVSLEGKAFWLVRRAPIGLGRYLVAKWMGHILPLLLMAEILSIASSWMIGTPGWLIAKSAFVVGILVVSLSGLGVGLGAMFPRFHIDNAAKIATGVGGILYMFLAIGLTMLVIILDAWPTYHLLRAEHLDGLRMPDNFWLKAAGFWGAALFFSLGSAGLAILLGRRRLSRR